MASLLPDRDRSVDLGLTGSGPSLELLGILKSRTKTAELGHDRFLISGSHVLAQALLVEGMVGVRRSQPFPSCT